ncbi:MAG: hypothetical protein CSB33_01550 [Desulfobacterales bacterium]|nr:MAG: hypothetical protein CSB33_01550 [Desulfobacterales bacterium]
MTKQYYDDPAKLASIGYFREDGIYIMPLRHVMKGYKISVRLLDVCQQISDKGTVTYRADVCSMTPKDSCHEIFKASYQNNDILNQIDINSQTGIGKWTIPDDFNAKDLQIIFTRKQYSLTTIVGEGGEVWPVGTQKISCGKTETITVTPYEGYELASLQFNGADVNPESCDKNGVCLYNVTEQEGDHTLRAAFSRRKMEIVIISGPGGTLFTEGPTPEYGQDCEFILTPDVGMRIKDVLINNISFREKLVWKDDNTAHLVIPVVRENLHVQALFTENCDLSISGDPSGDASVGEPWRFTPEATSSCDRDLIFYIQNQPVWCLFDPATGMLSGLPEKDDAGVFSDIRIGAKTEDGKTAELPAFEIVVQQPNQPPLIWGDPSPNATVGVVWQFQPEVDDPDDEAETLGFSIVNQPDWIDFNEKTGEVSGTPEVKGIYEEIRISVTDPSGNTTTLPSFFIDVASAATESSDSNDPPDSNNDGGGGGCFLQIIQNNP